MDYFNKFQNYTQTFKNLLGKKELDLLDLFFNSLIHHAMPRGFIGEAPEEEIWLRHILDSLLILQKEQIISEIKHSDIVIDLGSGAGLPGIPLGILFSDKSFVLVEATEKRAKYILEIKNELKLDNITVLNKRVEDLNSGDFTGLNRLVLFRAFLKPLVSLEMALRVLPEYTKKKTGSSVNNELKPTESSKVLYWRSRRFDISSESGNVTQSVLQQVNSRIVEMGYRISDFFNLECPPEMNNRGVYVIEYLGKASGSYPRSWSRIKKDVLINNII